MTEFQATAFGEPCTIQVLTAQTEAAPLEGEAGNSLSKVCVLTIVDPGICTALVSDQLTDEAISQRLLEMMIHAAHRWPDASRPILILQYSGAGLGQAIDTIGPKD